MMYRHTNCHKLDDAVLNAWQAQMDEASQKPWLAALLLKRGERILARFAHFYRQLMSLSRRTRRSLQRRLALSIAGTALMLALLNTPVHAAGITVTPGAAGISSGDGCSLVEAIINANNDAATHSECDTGSGADTITLSGNTYSYDTAFGTDSALPDISSAITIEGNDATIQRNSGNMRIVTVSGASGDLTLNRATISGGALSKGSGDPKAGGGGIYNNGGTLTVRNSMVSGNSVIHSANTAAGGGILTYNGTTTIENSTISGNSTSSSASPFGGGAGVYGFGGSTTLTNSVVTGNTSNRLGGGVGLYNGAHTISNSTISGNYGRDGGGLYAGASSSGVIVIVNNSTITGNDATADTGGIYVWTGTVNLNRSLVSGNTTTGSINEIKAANGGSVSANNYNLFGHSGETNAEAFSGFTPGANDFEATSDGTYGTPTALANILDTTLADNGGPTRTHALVTGSPSIDLVPAASCGVTIDQRGALRPELGGTDCDAGAHEYRTIVSGNPVQDVDITLNGVTFNFSDLGSLTTVTVERMSANHLLATNGINGTLNTGDWWHITGNGTGFTVAITLPYGSADSFDRVCKWPGNLGGYGWDCGDGTNTTADPGVSVTRTGLNSLSDWAVGNDVGPTAVRLLDISASSEDSSAIAALGSAALLALSTLWLRFRRRWRTRS